VTIFSLNGGYSFIEELINHRISEINDNGGQVWGLDLYDQSSSDRKPWDDAHYMVVITYDME
jgi:hypothetical protein